MLLIPGSVRTSSCQVSFTFITTLFGTRSSFNLYLIRKWHAQDEQCRRWVCPGLGCTSKTKPSLILLQSTSHLPPIKRHQQHCSSSEDSLLIQGVNLVYFQNRKQLEAKRKPSVMWCWWSSPGQEEVRVERFCPELLFIFYYLFHTWMFCVSGYEIIQQSAFMMVWWRSSIKDQSRGGKDISCET